MSTTPGDALRGGPAAQSEPVSDDRAASTTIVCCIESGPLEHQTVRLVESMRRWGGRYAITPIIAVTPRLGPPLLRSTHRALDRHHVEHLRVRARTRHAWHHYMNKPLAIVAAAERVSTPLMAWFDSDMLVVDEPAALSTAADEDFLACAAGKGDIGSTGPGDPREAYWAHACRVAGIDLDDLPWVTTEREGERIRLYWNSGLFVFRRASGFADDYLRLNVDLLDSRVGTVRYGMKYTDQVALGLSMVRCGLRWRPLGHSHNYAVSRYHRYVPEQLECARIVHYHDSLAADFFPEFADRMARHHPAVGSWLSTAGPLPGESIPAAAVQKALRAERSVRRRAFYRRCRWI